MCLILIKPKGVKYNDKILQYVRKGIVSNNDGFGVALHRHGVIVESRKFLKAEELISYLENTKIDKNFTLMVHLRMATHGQKSIENTHPFRLPYYKNFTEDGFKGHQQAGYTSSTSTAVMHNGVISSFSDPKNVKSDTYLFCEKFITKPLSSHPQYTMIDLLYKIKSNKKHDDPSILKVFNNYEYFRNNRLAFLNGEKGLIITGNWYKDCHGILLSNSTISTKLTTVFK